MKQHAIRAAFVCLAVSFSLPSLADHRGHGEGRHWKHHHRHDHDRYYGGHAGPGCRVEGWYDRGGYYRERQVCREPRVVGMPFPPMPPAVLLQPPSLVIQPPGVYFR